MRGWKHAYLDETNVGGLLTEALTADVQAVLADETGLVGADAAVEKIQVSQMSSFRVCDPLAHARATPVYSISCFIYSLERAPGIVWL
jgi:hypothetical protein